MPLLYSYRCCTMPMLLLIKALTIAAALANRSPFMSPFELRKEADASRRAFARGSQSDYLAIVNAYQVPTATYCHLLPHTATYCLILPHTVTHCHTSTTMTYSYLTAPTSRSSTRVRRSTLSAAQSATASRASASSV